MIYICVGAIVLAIIALILGIIFHKISEIENHVRRNSYMNNKLYEMYWRDKRK